MRAFVLSGGSTLGPAQVGAMQALFEQQILPDFIVGTSSGALNAAYIANEVSLAQLERLARIWRTVRREDVYPNHQVAVGWRLYAGADSLYDNRPLFHFLQRYGMPQGRTFAEHCQIPLYVTATHLHSGRLHVFGEQPTDCVLDALMASTALPPLHPPWRINNERYVDGGLVTPLPLRVALARGATEIYALYLSEDTSIYGSERDVHGVTAILARTINTTMHHAAKVDLMLAGQTPNVRLHEIPLTVLRPPDVIDFSQADRLIQFGYEQATRYLQQSSTHQRPHHRGNQRASLLEEAR